MTLPVSLMQGGQCLLQQDRRGGRLRTCSESPVMLTFSIEAELFGREVLAVVVAGVGQADQLPNQAIPHQMQGGGLW